MEAMGYREILREAFLEKAKRNSSFSMRAMAKHLGIAPSSLSEIFSGKKNLSRPRAIEFAERLNFSPSKSELFCDLVEYETCKNPQLKNQLLVRLNKRHAKTQFF